MTSTQSNLTRGLCLILSMACGTIWCRSQDLTTIGTKTLQNPGGGQVIYGSLVAQTSLVDGMASMLRKVQSRFGDPPQVGGYLKSREGSTLAAFFTIDAKSDGIKPMAGLVIVTATPGTPPQSAVLFDKANRFLSTEPELLHLLAAEGQNLESASLAGSPNPQTDAPTGPGAIGPMHLATGGDKSASVCLPTDWNIVQVSGGSLTAKGPHSEAVALSFYQMVIDPSSSQGHLLAHMPQYSSLPQAGFPDEEGLFTAFTNVLNQLRATHKLPPATFTLISSRSFNSIDGKVRPLEAIYDLDLMDGVGPRKGSARIDVIRTGTSPEWLMSISSSSIPVAYSAAEDATLRTIIKSFRQNEDVIGMQIGGGPGGDRIRRDHDHGDYMPGEKAKPVDCAKLNEQLKGTSAWPAKVAEGFILDAAAVEKSGSAPQAVSAAELSERLVKSHPGTFEFLQFKQEVQSLDY